MIGWLWRILVGRFHECEHKWIHRGTHKVVMDDHDEVPLYHRQVCQCEKCGKWKSFKV